MNILNEVNEYLKFLEQEDKSPQTIRQYSFVLHNFAGRCEEITKPSVRNFYDCFIAQKSAATRKQYTAAVNSFFEWLIEEELLESNPLKHNKIPKTKVPPPSVSYIPEKDLSSITKRISLLDTPLKIAFTIMREGGLRATEVCDLNVDSVHFTSKGLELVVIGKGRKTRVLPFYKGTLTYQLLMEYTKGLNPMCPLFNNAVGKRISYWDLEYTWTKKVSDRYTMHQLRHSKGKDMLQQGVPLEIVQEWFGHSNISTSRRYAAVSKNVSNREIEKYQTV